MNKLYFILLLLAVFGFVAVDAHANEFEASVDAEAHACTQEAKICPDGSYVGRSGPNCEFAECPGGDTEKAVEGKDYNAARSNKPTSGNPQDTDGDGHADPAIREGGQTIDAGTIPENQRGSVNNPTDTDGDGYGDVMRTEPDYLDEDSDDDAISDGNENEERATGNTNAPPGAQVAPSQTKVILLGAMSPDGEPVAMRASEVRGWDQEKKEAFLESVKARAELQSGEDLENFARGVLIENERIESIETTEDRLTVESRTSAKFLGIFKTSLRTNIQINEEGEVEEKRPWYSFLYTKPNLKQSIEQSLEAKLTATGEDAQLANIETQNTFQVTAQVLEIVAEEVR